MSAETVTRENAFIELPVDECEAIVADLSGAIDGLLDTMLESETTRVEMFPALMKVASARYLARKLLEEHDEKHAEDPTRDTVSP